MCVRQQAESQCKVECTAAARLALDPHSATHHLRELRRNGQAQARTAVIARRRAVDLCKGFKNEPLLLLRDANAGVSYVEVKRELRTHACFHRRANLHFPSVSKLQGVAH